MTRYIRLGDKNDLNIAVCEHIKIRGSEGPFEELAGGGTCEFEEELIIFCPQCNKEYQLTVMIN